ncbi:Uncharacterised protein [Neisseria animaloris]|nr:Uncharacterised protein [Neisseria animaloris]
MVQSPHMKIQAIMTQVLVILEEVVQVRHLYYLRMLRNYIDMLFLTLKVFIGMLLMIKE